MKKLLLMILACTLWAWQVQAADTFEAGVGFGVVSLGKGSTSGTTWITYATAEMPLDFGQGSDIRTSVVGRIGTTGTSSQTLVIPPAGAVTVDQTLDYFLSALFKGGFNVMPDLTVYGLAGFSHGSATVTASSPLVAVSGSSTDSSFSWGVGADYRLDNQLTIGVDYTAYWSDVTAFAANVRWSF